MKTTQLAIIGLAFVVGIGGGYLLGKSYHDTEMQNAPSPYSMTDMEHMGSMMKMAEMMKSSGVYMQQMGTQYKDDSMMMRGKDMMMIGDRYMEETISNPADHSAHH